MLQQKDRSKQILLGSIIGGLLFLGGFGWLIWSDWKEIQEAEKSTQELRTRIAKAESEIRQIPTVEDKVLILRERVKRHVAILPDDAEINAFVDKLTQFKSDAGVEVVQLDDTLAKRNTGTRKKTSDPFERVVYKLKLRAPVANLLRFMDLFENKYERFVSITQVAVKLDRQRMESEPDPSTGELPPPPPHDVDLELETYVYNPKDKSGAEAVAIRQEPQKLERLRREGLLDGDDNDLDLAVYRFEPRAERRDPFADPRRKEGAGPRVTEAERQAQLAALDNLRGRIEQMRVAIAEEASIAQLVQRMQRIQDNNRALQELDAHLAKLTDATFFTVAEYAAAFESEIRAPFRAMLESRNLTPIAAEVKLQHVREHVARMREALDRGDHGEVIKLHQQLDPMRDGNAGNEALKELFADADQMNGLATAHVEFRNREFRFGGSVCYDGDPAQSVVIINNRSYSPGESVEEGLVVASITKAEVVFDFRGIKVSRKFQEGSQ